MALISYRRHRFPPIVIQHAVWLYLRFTLSYRDVEELLAQRGLDISYESVRSWVLKFGAPIARALRRCRPRPSDRWHLDEMVVRIAGKHLYLWSAVDHEGEVLEILVQRRRDKRAAVRLLRKLLRKQGFAPKKVTTDKLRSYGAAVRHLELSCHHEQGLRQNNRAENSHQAARAQDATLQISGIGTTVPERARSRLQYLQPPAPSRLPVDASPLPIRSGSALAYRDYRSMRPSPVAPNLGCNALT
jgi:putative transposase